MDLWAICHWSRARAVPSDVNALAEKSRFCLYVGHVQRNFFLSASRDFFARILQSVWVSMR